MRSGFAGALALLLAAIPHAARADAPGDCSHGRDAALRLKACTEVIGQAAFAPADKAVAYRNRGSTRLSAGAISEALADFGEAIRLGPNDASAYAGRAQARLAGGDVDGAIADFSQALQIVPPAPASVGYLIGRGHAYLVKGLADHAIADFTQAIGISPKSVSALNNRGLAFSAKGDLASAVADYTAAITNNPVYALAYNNRGYAFEKLGRRDEAVADFNKALLLDRSLTGANAGLKRLKSPDRLAEESDAFVLQGKELVDANCSRCHAVGPSGASPNPKAPEFRTLASRHPVLALREPLARGITVPHDEMPKFALNKSEIVKIVTYINALQANTRK